MKPIKLHPVEETKHDRLVSGLNAVQEIRIALLRAEMSIAQEAQAKTQEEAHVSHRDTVDNLATAFERLARLCSDRLNPQ